MNINVENGPEWPVDPKFNPICGFDTQGKPVSLTLGAGGSLTIGDGGTPITVIGSTNVVRATFNRPADTTQYAANDAVSDSTSAPTIITLADVARVNGGTGIITDLRLSTNSATITNASFKVILFSDIITAVNDNAAYPQLWANDAKRIASFDLTLQTGGTGSDAASATLEQLGRIFKCTAGSKNLYAAIVANAAYTPANGQTFALTLGVALD